MNIHKILAGAMEVSGVERMEYLDVYNQVMKGIAVGNGWQRLRMVEIERVGNTDSGTNGGANDGSKDGSTDTGDLPG